MKAPSIITAALIALITLARTPGDAAPSIVLIQADDVSKDMFSPWNPRAGTPTIDRLARDGALIMGGTDDQGRDRHRQGPGVGPALGRISAEGAYMVP